MRLLNLDKKIHFEQVVKILKQNFKHWIKDDNDVIKEFKELLLPDRISRVLLNDDEKVIGWISGISCYKNNAWELQSLVIKKEYQKKGYSKILLKDFECEVYNKKGVTIYLKINDELNQTNICEKKLFPKVLEKLKNNNHSYEFYQKNGFEIIGVIPNAGGKGKSNIIMAKNVEKVSRRVSLYITKREGKNKQILVFSCKEKEWLGTQVPGGGVEINENLENALKREMKEETGLSLNDNYYHIGSYFFYNSRNSWYQIREFYHMQLKNDIKEFSHKVSGNGVDKDDVFNYSWIKLDENTKLSFELSEYLYKII